MADPGRLWIYPSDGDWIGIYPEGAQPGPLATLQQYLRGELPTSRDEADLWDSDIAWVLSDGPEVAVPLPEDSFAVNSAQAAAALGLLPGRFILIPAVPELTDHSHCGLPSRRVLLAKQTEDSDEEGGCGAAPIPYILDLRPVQLYLCQAAAPDGIVDVAEICQRLMIRCPRGFHVRLYGGAFDDDAGNHSRRVEAGDTISVEYHPDYVRDFVSQLEPDTYSPGTSLTASQGSAHEAANESASSVHSGSADAGTGGSAAFNRGHMRQHGEHITDWMSAKTLSAAQFAALQACGSIPSLVCAPFTMARLEPPLLVRPTSCLLCSGYDHAVCMTTLPSHLQMPCAIYLLLGFAAHLLQ